jgi:serine protease Do
VQRGWLGVQIQDIDEDLAEGFGLKHAGGAAVADVVEDSPADKAGIEVGDVIVRFGDRDIDGAKTLGQAVAETDPEDKVGVKVWRNGKEKTVHVTLGESEDSSQTLRAGCAGVGR